MNDISIALVCTVVGTAGTLLGVLIGYKTYKKASEKDIKDETKKATDEVKEDTQNGTQVKMQLNYISRGIDDIKIDIKAQDRRISEVVERVAKVEESAKSAHHRLDTIEEKIK